jgi:diguanylate cyclase (GGDEF)-like protein
MEQWPAAGVDVPFQSMPSVVFWALVPLLYYAGAKLGVSAAVMPEGIAILWPPNSVLLTAMLIRPARDMPLIAALGIATEIVADLPTFTLTEASIFGIANALESSVACLLLRAWHFDPRLGRIADLRKFVLAGPVIGALLAAASGAAAYAYFRAGQTSYLEFLRIWWMGDAMGLLIFTPLLMSVAVGHPANPSRVRALDAAVAAIGAALTAALALSHSGTLWGMHIAPVLVLPCVVYLATRFDLRVVSASVAIVGLALAYAMAHGRDPFGVLPPHEATMRTQEFIFTMSLLALGLTALLEQLRAKQRELGEANEQLDQVNRHLESRVAERTAQLDDSNRQLQQLAMTDSLTGIANRRAFFAAARGVVESSLRHHRPLALVMADVDHFKAINDRYGHATGDAVLCHVAGTLEAMLRAADSLARYGGEEFILLAPETDIDSALALARRMGDTLRAAPVVVGDAQIRVTASFGVSALDERGDTLDRLIQRADAALYECKRAGRDRALAVQAERGQVPQP